MKTKTCGDCKSFPGMGYYCPIIGRFCDPNNEKPCEFFAKPFGRKPTNGDRIRQMSNERLAGFISSRVECLGGALGLADCPGDQMNCVKCWEIWLNAPAESEVSDE